MQENLAKAYTAQHCRMHTRNSTQLPTAVPSNMPRALVATDPFAIQAVLIAVRQAAQVLCDRATLLVLLHAHTSACKYAEFAERTGLGNRLLSTRLVQLTEAGLLVRIPYSRRPLRHAYHLTHMGVALFDVLALLATWEQAWSETHSNDVGVRLEHLGCAGPDAGARNATTRLHCAACGDAVDPRDVALRLSYTEMARMPGKSTATRRSNADAAGPSAQSGLAPPLRQCLAVLGDKWSIEVLVCAFFGVHQFGDFSARIGISTNILTDRLNRLQEAGLFRRTVQGDRLRTGLYLLTAKGRDFYGILIAIQSWADDWIDHRVRSPVKLRHTLCQKSLRPRLVCKDCGQPLNHTQGVLRIEPPATIRRAPA